MNLTATLKVQDLFQKLEVNTLIRLYTVKPHECVKASAIATTQDVARTSRMPSSVLHGFVRPRGRRRPNGLWQVLRWWNRKLAGHDCY